MGVECSVRVYDPPGWDVGEADTELGDAGGAGGAPGEDVAEGLEVGATELDVGGTGEELGGGGVVSCTELLVAGREGLPDEDGATVLDVTATGEEEGALETELEDGVDGTELFAEPEPGTGFPT